jgi:hypothetical protein
MRSKLRSSARGLPRGSLSVCASLVSCFMISLSRATTTLRASDSTRKGTSPMSQTCSRLIHTTITIKSPTIPMPGGNGCSQDVQLIRSTAYHRDYRVHSRELFDNSDCRPVSFNHPAIYLLSNCTHCHQILRSRMHSRKS